MRILVLGGTAFVGRHIAEAALAAGHEVTIFHRGTTGAGLFPNAKEILGDRNSDLDRLRSGQWDAVIDTCCYTPAQMQDAIEVLKPNVPHYIFISTLSVYKDGDPVGITEDYPVAKAPTVNPRAKSAESYGPQKAIAEDTLRAGYGDEHCLILRCGIIVGPYDYLKRFNYWVLRVKAGGSILCPGNPEAPLQWIDGRDLAAWVIDGAVNKRFGTFNVTGPDYPLTFAKFLSTARDTLQSKAEFVWAGDSFLMEHEVSLFSGLPFWLAHHSPGFFQVDHSKARREGLSYRPLKETILDTLNSLSEHRPSRAQDLGFQLGEPISRERERELLRLLQSNSVMIKG